MKYENLQSLLESSARGDHAANIISYPLGSTKTPRTITSSELLDRAKRNSEILRARNGFHGGRVVLIHLSDHLDSIIWCWAVLYAGGLPAMSTPFSNNPEHRVLHIKHLSKTLKDPLCITNMEAIDQFSGQHALQPVTIESLEAPPAAARDSQRKLPSPDDNALLMLTSGSTGDAKAVCLSHGQILSAINGKSSVIQLPEGGSFLNWIGTDHVASMIEIHLQALLVGVSQVHVHATDILMDPIEFIRLIEKHRVSRTFAPNFFLARLRTALESTDVASDWDLSSIRYIASGGEANVTDTCVAVTSLLTKYGAPQRTIIPGFGMTETCAGSIFNTDCPNYDIQNHLELASVGDCMPGIAMRITDGPRILPADETGDLEVKGAAVFKEYFNNEHATAEAFTADGWFKTGDQGFIDASGCLNLAGRAKDTVIVNGVKYNPTDIELALEEAQIPGVTPSFTVCFSSLRPGAQTEEICVIYLPGYTAEDSTARLDALGAIVKTVILQTGARPYVLPLDRAVLQKSSLGKLSRSKIKVAFERGDYKTFEETNSEIVRLQRNVHHQKPMDQTEELLLKVFLNTLQLGDQDFDVTTSIFETGITSIELIRLKRNIQEHLDLMSEIPMVTLMTNSTIRSLVAALQEAPSDQRYESTVVLQQQGTKVPLWLIHPGVGEVLVFLNLAKYVRDRPVYALRARGFNKGERYFEDIDDAITVYHGTIKRKQPHGPYAIAGYSYGSMLAFEVAKRLESNGDEVGFLGSFNLPPHIKSRMRQLNWTECILHLSYFLNLVGEKHARQLADELRSSSKEEVLATVLTNADSHRLAELSLTPLALLNWANLAFALQSMATDYEPSNSVAAMDVFYCTPLAIVSSSRQEWLAEHLSKWSDFCRSQPRFHEVSGEHYTMLGPDHVLGFQKILNKALKGREI